MVENRFSNAIITFTIDFNTTEFFSLSQVYEKRWFCGWRSNVATVGILPFLNYNLSLFSIVYGNFESISLKMQYSFAVVWNQNRMQMQKCQ